MSNSMKEPATATWGLSISDADFEKLKKGFEPESWDDKWGVSAEEQSQSRNVSIHVTRNPTGKDSYVLDIRPQGEDSGEGVKVEAITWDQKRATFTSRRSRPKRKWSSSPDAYWSATLKHFPSMTSPSCGTILLLRSTSSTATEHPQMASSCK
ncbi:hypothetical protein PG990_002047 [Apiospora arundinis]